jgi:hypothetical protein
MLELTGNIGQCIVNELLKLFVLQINRSPDPPDLNENQSDEGQAECKSQYP